ncbi:hypothetical protein FRC20_004234 [Serendipita sp. 405]|nr:hypothetical protein FRC16_005771 [Serendipita sp. 398]KAG8782773.1 hypothetical protein FRC15_006398 [Serendipita sp. 397]KAG8842822.1 hypothetical protein FRC20_004234 [Serendipita sp. 405]
MPNPDLQHGLDYWAQQEASIDGVLGGYGNGSLPRVDALSSRLFLLSVLPNLCKTPSPLRKLGSTTEKRRFRALDAGAGIGRVTDTVLLHLFDEVVLLEPVQSLIAQAVASSITWKGIASKQNSVLFIKQPLQHYNPSSPITDDQVFAQTGAVFDTTQLGFDVILTQWMLGHLSDRQVIKFLRQAKESLRTGGIIMVKENCCSEEMPGEPEAIYDSDDSSITRSDSGWKQLFGQAGVTLVKEEVQKGFPEGLYEVKSYALR